MQPLITLALCFILLSGSLAFAGPQFSDIGDHWAQADIQQLADVGLVSGHGDGEFKPYDYMSQDTFLALLHNVQPQVDINQLVTKQHLPEHPWKANALGSTDTTTTDAEHEPRFLTRAEAFALMAEMAQLPVVNPQQTQAILNHFSDGAAIPRWQQPYVATAIQQQWVHPVFPQKNVLHGQHYLRRGEAAYLVNQLRHRVTSTYPLLSAP